jgi:hypothetical protein
MSASAIVLQALEAMPAPRPDDVQHALELLQAARDASAPERAPFAIAEASRALRAMRLSGRLLGEASREPTVADRCASSLRTLPAELAAERTRWQLEIDAKAIAEDIFFGNKALHLDETRVRAWEDARSSEMRRRDVTSFVALGAAMVGTMAFVVAHASMQRGCI